jgi:thiosulfate/3-mercaptopyruvate sulfurtransferase
MHHTLISASQLQALQQSGQPLMVFDCSFDLMQPELGDAQFLQGHIAGAVRANLDQDLCGGKGGPAINGGRHPLPTRAHLAAWLNRLGFRNDMQAVVYDRQGMNYCGRLWWMLQWAGHEAVAVLDGGWQAWQEIEGAIQTGPQAPPPSPGAYTLQAEKVSLVSTETLLKNLGRANQNLVDARDAARFRGEVEPFDPVAGHIPGAQNRPFKDNFDSQGRFKPANQLLAQWRHLLAGRAPESVVHHCGSGVSAIPNILAMKIAGLGTTALYAGGWSEWCSNPQRPVVTQGAQD